MSKVESDKSEKTTFSDTISSDDTSKVSTTAQDSGTAVVNQACKYCGEQIVNAKVKSDGKVNCPACEKDN